MYASDAFAFLSGIQGALHGGAEFGAVFQALSTDTLSTLDARSCAGGGLTAFAYNFRVGTRRERLAQFWIGNRLGDANAPEFAVGDSASSNRVVMAPVNSAMCAFTRIQGEFAGSGEWVQIRPETIGDHQYWVLRSSRGADSKYVHARARCLHREQRPIGPFIP